MVQRRHVEIVDDIDGTAAAETVKLSLDGKAYEIDLSAKNRKALDKALKPFLAAARRQKRGYVRSA